MYLLSLLFVAQLRLVRELDYRCHYSAPEVLAFGSGVTRSSTALEEMHMKRLPLAARRLLVLALAHHHEDERAGRAAAITH